MDMPATAKTLEQVDPIWKRLYVDRVWSLIFAAFCIFYLCYYAWATYTGANKNAGITGVYLMYIFLWFFNVAGHFRQESYWKRIGQRRLEAMQDAQAFLAANQPAHSENAPTSPILLRLRWHRGILIAVSILVLIPILLLIIFGCLDLYQHNHTFDFLEPLIFFIATILLLGIVLYFAYLRNMPSLIEVSEEGIRTRYLRQERFLRWDEARVFATYDAQGTKKSLFASTYELSNERTVVRWSQQMLTNPFLFLALESNMDKKEDWNWQIGRINSIVASRTDLPLLDLSDKKQKRSMISGRRNGFSRIQTSPVTSEIAAPAPIHIAQDDPLANRVQLNGETGKALWGLGAIGIIALVLGLVGKLGTNNHAFTFLSMDIVNPLLWVGALFLLLTVLSLLTFFYTGKYWSRISRKRQQALQQPKHFLVPGQPEAQNEQPLPATMRIHIRKSFFFPMLFLENFVIFLILTFVIFQWPHKNLLATLLGTLCFALLMSLAFLPILGRSNGSRIEIRSDGIATRYGTVDSYVSWDDARLFARYGSLRLLKRSSRIQIYELASEHSVVRWQWSHSRLWTMTLTPQMSREEFDRWLEQLQSYIVARTGLLLMDLDGSNSPIDKPKG